jgi:hypothetical protein
MKYFMKLFSRITNEVSKSRIPMLALSVPIHDMLMNRLEDIQSSVKTSAEMKKALGCGLEKLKSYYRKTDACQMYSIATSKYCY